MFNIYLAYSYKLMHVKRSVENNLFVLYGESHDHLILLS